MWTSHIKLTSVKSDKISLWSIFPLSAALRTKSKMRVLVAATLVLVALNTYAVELNNCDEPLDESLKILAINSAFGVEFDSKPGANYSIDDFPNVCLSGVSNNNSLFVFLIHSDLDSNNMVIQKIDRKNSNSFFYGPFLSEPKELKEKLINDIKKKLTERGILFNSSDFNEGI